MEEDSKNLYGFLIPVISPNDFKFLCSKETKLEIIAGSLGGIHKQENTEFNQLKHTQKKYLNLCQKLNE